MTPDDPIRWYDRIAPLYDPIILGSYNRAREATVLDVACGTGENFHNILEKIGNTGLVTGTDYSKGILETNGHYAIMDWYIPKQSLFTRFVNPIAARDISRR